MRKPWKATTIHNLFDFDSDYVSKLDFAKVTQTKVAALIQLQVLLLDEVSMLDYVCFNSICKVLSDIDHCRRPDATAHSDLLGCIAFILFGDLKQGCASLNMRVEKTPGFKRTPNICFGCMHTSIPRLF